MKTRPIFIVCLLAVLIFGNIELRAQGLPSPSGGILRGHAASGPALVASTSAASTTGNNVTTGSINTTGANLIVAIVASQIIGAPTLTDSKSNSWGVLPAYAELTGTAQVRMFYVALPSVGSGHTFTLTGTSDYPAIIVFAFSGALNPPYDVESGQGATGTTVQPGSVTPSQNNSIIVTGLFGYTATSASVDLGFTATVVPYGAGTNYGAAGAYLLQGSAASVNPTWTVGATQLMAADITVFKPQ